MDALSGYGQIFFRNSRYSGVVPQISVIMGPCAGGAVYSPALTDFIFMVERESQMFITGPQVIEAITGEEVSAEELGGAYTHNTVSGVAHFRCETEEDCMAQVRALLGYLPSNAEEKPPVQPYESEADELRPALNEIIPTNPDMPYDMKDVIAELVDNGIFFEVQPEYADNIITCFARVGGRSVGLLPTSPIPWAAAWM